MSISFGSQISYTTIFDIKDTLIISFGFKNLLFTCGHCLPLSINFNDKNFELIYTSGFDTDDEDIELGIIKSKYKLVEKKYKFLKKQSLDNNKLSFKTKIKLIKNDIKYYCYNLFILNYDQFNNLIKDKINKIDFGNDEILYFIHAITKIITNKILFNKLSLNKCGFYLSNHYSRSLTNEDLKYIDNKFKLETNIFNYLTEPSFSGSPIFLNNTFIGYHIGSVNGYIVKNNVVIWIGKIGYYKIVELIC